MKKIQILGMGCAKCNHLYASAENAAKELGIVYDIEKITDIQKIMNFGVTSTPALVVDGVVKTVGKIPNNSEIKEILK